MLLLVSLSFSVTLGWLRPNLWHLGWDPATGLGLPKFKEMLKLAMAEDEGQYEEGGTLRRRD